MRHARKSIWTFYYCRIYNRVWRLLKLSHCLGDVLAAQHNQCNRQMCLCVCNLITVREHSTRSVRFCFTCCVLHVTFHPFYLLSSCSSLLHPLTNFGAPIFWRDAHRRNELAGKWSKLQNMTHLAVCALGPNVIFVILRGVKLYRNSVIAF